MRFDYPDLFAPMAATLIAVGVTLVIGLILGFIALQRAFPEDRGVRLGMTIAIVTLLIVIGAPTMNGLLQNAQNGALEEQQRAWVTEVYGIQLTDAQYDSLKFPMMQPGEGTIIYGSVTIEQGAVELASVNGEFGLRTPDGMPFIPS